MPRLRAARLLPSPISRQRQRTAASSRWARAASTGRPGPRRIASGESAERRGTVGVTSVVDGHVNKSGGYILSQWIYTPDRDVNQIGRTSCREKVLQYV